MKNLRYALCCMCIVVYLLCLEKRTLEQLKGKGCVNTVDLTLHPKATTPSKFKKFLEIIDKALRAGKVLVHCRGGSGCTGTMAETYWIHKGLSAENAIKKVREANPAAVENPKQEKSLLNLEKAMRRKKN